MKNSQHHNRGFSLIEVVLAMAIFATLSAAIFTLMNSVFNSAYKTHAVVSRFFYIKNMFVDYKNIEELAKDPKREITQTIQEPAVTVHFKVQPIKNEAVAKKYEHSFVAKASGIWQDIVREKEEDILGIVFIQKQEPKE